MFHSPQQAPRKLKSDLEFPLPRAKFLSLFQACRDPSKNFECIQLVNAIVAQCGIPECLKTLKQIREGELFQHKDVQLQISPIGTVFESNNYDLLNFLCRRFGANDVFNSFCARESKRDYQNKRVRDFMTPLHMAVISDNAEQVEHLLGDSRVDPNLATSRLSWTPLICLSQYGTLPLLCSMYRRPDVELNRANYQGATPLHFSAARQKNSDLDDPDEPILLPLMLNLHHGTVRKNGMDVNAVNFENATPLGETMKLRPPQWRARVLLMLAYGASPEVVPDEYRTDPIFQGFNTEIGQAVRDIIGETVSHLNHMTEEVYQFRQAMYDMREREALMQQKYDKLKEQHEALAQKWIRNEGVRFPAPERRRREIYCKETRKSVLTHESAAYAAAERVLTIGSSHQKMNQGGISVALSKSLPINPIFITPDCEKQLSTSNILQKMSNYVVNNRDGGICVAECGSDYRIPCMAGQKQVIARRGIRPGEILGQYIGSRYVEAEFDQMYRHDPHLKQTADEYCFEITDTRKSNASILVIDVVDRDRRNIKNVDNLLIFVNDCRMDITGPETEADMEAQNAMFIKGFVNNRPELFLVALRPIAKGAEVLAHYGSSYPELDASRKKLENEQCRRRRFLGDSKHNEPCPMEVDETVQSSSATRKRRLSEPEERSQPAKRRRK